MSIDLNCNSAEIKATTTSIDINELNSPQEEEVTSTNTKKIKNKTKTAKTKKSNEYVELLELF